MPLAPTTSRPAASPVSVATATLTDAQVKSLPTTAVQIVAAPGAGFALMPLHAVLRLSWAADYTNISATSTVRLQTGTSADISTLEEVRGDVTGLLANGESSSGWLAPLSVVSLDPTSRGLGGFLDGDWGDRAVSIAADNAAAGNFTGGNAANVLKVTLLYYVVTF